jgi:hypothetical protein
VHLFRIAFTKIAAVNAKLSPEDVLALTVRSVNSMKTLTGLSRLEIDCGRPARHPPQSDELFAFSPPVLPASAHEIDELMNAADEKRQLHQVTRARQRLNAILCDQVSGRPPALRNIYSFLNRHTSLVRSQSGWRGPAIVIAPQHNVFIGFMRGIVVLCHRTRARLFERSSRDEKPSPLLDDDAFLPFQGKGVDSSASSALTAQDADDFVQSPFVKEFMPVELEDVEFRDVAETRRHLRVCSDDPEQVARVARASAAGPASNLSQLMKTAPVRDTAPDVSSSAAEPVTSVEHMDDDEDDDDRPPGEELPSESPHVLTPSHSAPELDFQPNADPFADFPSLGTRSKRPVPDEDDDNSGDKNAEAETKRQRIHLSAALYSYNLTLDDEGDEIDWNQLSDEEFESKMEKLNVKERGSK